MRIYLGQWLTGKRLDKGTILLQEGIELNSSIACFVLYSKKGFKPLDNVNDITRWLGILTNMTDPRSKKWVIYFAFPLIQSLLIIKILMANLWQNWCRCHRLTSILLGRGTWLYSSSSWFYECIHISMNIHMNTDITARKGGNVSHILKAFFLRHSSE